MEKKKWVKQEILKNLNYFLINDEAYQLCRKINFVGVAITVDGKAIFGANHPVGVEKCKKCLREKTKHGERLENCRAIHMETDILMRALRNNIDLNGATLYYTGKSKGKWCAIFPCTMCARILYESGIKRVEIYRGKKWESYTMEQILINSFKVYGIENNLKPNNINNKKYKWQQRQGLK